MITMLFLACSGPDTDTGSPTDEASWACGTDAPDFGTVELSSVSLHYACQGAGPTVLMLHGFPEFWMGWADVMPLIADAGYRVVAPDQRGYNLSDKPDSVDEYVLSLPAADADELISKLGGPVVLVGHDWGGATAWAVASAYPEQVDRLVILNAPHMNVFADELANNPEQADAFSYLDFFVSEGSENFLAANDFAALSAFFGDALDDDALAAYKEAWGQPGALTGGLNWYRANFTDGLPNTTETLDVSVPSLVVWGMDDTALLPSNLDGLPAYVDDLTIQEVEGATHWISHEVPQTVADAILDFID